MPIAKTVKLAEKKTVEIVRPEVMPPPQPVAVDTQYTPKRNLLTHIAGGRWDVTYYSQLKTREEGAEPFDYNRPAPYQQYIKVENFELRVTTPLTVSPDTDNANMSITGVAVIYPSIVPNQNDHFIADIGDGRSGFFKITEVIQKSHLRDTAYEIEYELQDWVNHDLLKKLEEKVVKSTYYVRDYSAFGADPILDQEQYNLYQKTMLWNERIARHYFDSFFSSEYRTFLVPDKDLVIYDPFIVEFLRCIWSTDDIPELGYLRVYNRDTSFNKFTKTIWDAILDNDIYTLAKAKHHFGIIPRRLLQAGDPSLVSVAYSRLDYIYHPFEYDDINDEKITIEHVGEFNKRDIFSRYAMPRSLTLPVNKLPGLSFFPTKFKDNVPEIRAKKQSTFNTYVLSESFYKQDLSEMSILEKMVLKTLKGEFIDIRELYPILEDVINWGELERFYYIPVLVALSRTALGELSQ